MTNQIVIILNWYSSLKFWNLFLLDNNLLWILSLIFTQVTILVAAEGVHKLPTINGSSDLKEALQKLAAIPARKTLVYIV